MLRGEKEHLVLSVCENGARLSSSFCSFKVEKKQEVGVAAQTDDGLHWYIQVAVSYPCSFTSAAKTGLIGVISIYLLLIRVKLSRPVGFFITRFAALGYQFEKLG